MRTPIILVSSRSLAGALCDQAIDLPWDRDPKTHASRLPASDALCCFVALEGRVGFCIFSKSSTYCFEKLRVHHAEG